MKIFDKIIFVGRTGNNREVMAAALLKQKAIWTEPEILARGLVVLFEEPLNQKVEAILISSGIQLGNFTSTALTEEDFGRDVLVLTFDQKLKESIENKFEQAQNVYVLTDVTGDELDIFDPHGQELVSYGLCFETIEKTLNRLVDVLNDGTWFEEQEKANEEVPAEAVEDAGSSGEEADDI